MDAVFSSPLFGIVLCIFTFEIGVWLNRKTHSPLANPLLIAVALCIAFLQIFSIPLADFNEGGRMISMFLAPATAALALSIYGQIDVLKKNLLPIAAGTLVGSLTSIISVLGLCKLFGLSDELTASLIPKSVTTPIAMEISQQQGGIVYITVAAVIVTGIFGAIFAPTLLKLFQVKDPVEAGIAIGTCSHALGTSKAVELGEVEGAMSGIAIGAAGIFTVLLSMFL